MNIFEFQISHSNGSGIQVFIECDIGIFILENIVHRTTPAFIQVHMCCISMGLPAEVRKMCVKIYIY